MTTLREAAQQLVDRIDREGSTPLDWREYDALRAALAEPEDRQTMTPKELADSLKRGEKWRVAEPLTDDAIVAMWHQPVLALSALELARAIERAHGIGEAA